MQDLNQPDENKPSRPHTSLTQLIYRWKWELFIWFLGTIGLLSILTLISIFNGTSQKDWHSDIQITAFVAALAQVSQSALLVPTASSIAQLKWKWVSHVARSAIDLQKFDLASRGPDGSMRLLWHFAWRQ
jgi:NhaP-type Na+/H+ or K+/H+ antiporter